MLCSVVRYNKYSKYNECNKYSKYNECSEYSKYSKCSEYIMENQMVLHEIKI